MTTSQAITDIMHAHIAGIREDAARSARRPAAEGLEADRRRKIATRLERINMRLDELSAFVLAV